MIDASMLAYGLATLLVAAWSVMGGAEARFAGSVVAVNWALCRVAEFTQGGDIAPDQWALVDFMSCTVFALAHVRRPTPWVCVLALTYGLQCGMHLLYQLDWRYSRNDTIFYLWLLAGVYIVQLGLISWGGRSAVDVLRLAGLRLLRWLRDAYRPQHSQNARGRNGKAAWTAYVGRRVGSLFSSTARCVSVSHPRARGA